MGYSLMIMYAHDGMISPASSTGHRNIIFGILFTLYPLVGNNQLLQVAAEALYARTHNLICSIHLLCINGFYDDSLNLIRSIGEIAIFNIFSIYDKKGLRELFVSDSKTRMKILPCKIRNRIEELDRVVIVGKDCYSKFCGNMLL